VTRAFAPQLAGGTLVNVASVLSWLPGFGAYGVSKAALWSATNSLRAELSEQDTNVIGVYLGYTDTPMVADLDVPKNDPADVARQIVDGIESGATEVLADELTRQARTTVFA
jgi:NAD(P)-dependent dehydrogenase (short-subunit alcohol dehydrogenase family)